MRAVEHALRLAGCLASWCVAVVLLAHGHTAWTIVALLGGAGLVLPWRQM